MAKSGASIFLRGINPLSSARETVALTAITIFAAAILLCEAWRVLSVPDHVFSLLALVSLVASTTLWARRPAGGAMLATFLPAIPLAAYVMALEGSKRGASAFASVALAFQLRCLLLHFARRYQQRRESIAANLRKSLPETATVFIDNDIESEVKLDALREGHMFRLAPGQIVPADGLVTFGSGFVHDRLSPHAPEKLKLKGMGSQVFAGSLNKNGSLLVRATAVGEQTFLGRFAARIRFGTEASISRLLAIDGVLTLGAISLTLASGPASALRMMLVTSGAGILASFALFELGLAEHGAQRLWLWRPGGVRRLAEAGMLVLRSEGVLSEGRPKLVAIECASLSEDAALGMLGPLARKLETPAAFAVLQELRARNIPLQLIELFQPVSDGATGIIACDEVRWISLAQRTEELALGTLEPFVREHLSAGDELHLLEREGKLEAAAAFRDPPIAGAANSVEELRRNALPMLLVSTMPKRAVARLKTELSLEHAQGEATEAETDALMDRLTEEGLAPTWVQTSAFRPRRFAAVASLPNVGGEGADLLSPDLSLPSLAASQVYARAAHRQLRSLHYWIFGTQIGLLLWLLGSDARIVTLLGIGRAWATPLEAGLALAGVLPGFLALAFASPPLPPPEST